MNPNHPASTSIYSGYHNFNSKYVPQYWGLPFQYSFNDWRQQENNVAERPTTTDQSFLHRSEDLQTAESTVTRQQIPRNLPSSILARHSVSEIYTVEMSWFKVGLRILMWLIQNYDPQLYEAPGYVSPNRLGIGVLAGVCLKTHVGVGVETDALAGDHYRH